MGIILEALSVSDSNIERIESDPHLIWRLLWPEDENFYLESLGVGRKPGLIGRLFGAKEVKRPTEIPNLQFVDGECHSIDLDKSWHGIHYCINKSAEPTGSLLDFLLENGRELKPIAVGDSYRRFFESSDVHEIAKMIDTLTVEELKRNYEPEKMTASSVYPDIWNSDEQDQFEYIESYFLVIKNFLQHCRQHKLGMAICLS